MAWNFPEDVWVGTNKLITTRIEMPTWCTSEVFTEIVKTPLFMVGKYKVKYSNKDFYEVVSDMFSTPWIENKYQGIDSDKILDVVVKEINVDGEYILDWMRDAFAQNAAITVMQANMVNVGAFAEGASNDGYIPGVKVQDISYVSEPSSVITKRGYAKVNTPYGDVKSPVIDKKSIIKDMMLAWSAIPWTGIKQWLGALIKWIKLAASPLMHIHLPNVSIGGLTSPQFLAHIPPHFGFINDVETHIASNKDQKLLLIYRNPRNFTQEFFRLAVPLRANTVAKIRYRIYSLFGVPPFLVQAETPDNGLIDIQQYTVKSRILPIPFF